MCINSWFSHIRNYKDGIIDFYACKREYFKYSEESSFDIIRYENQCNVIN